MNRSEGIDIIVPVYNALEHLRVCVSSIQEHTDLRLDRLILIDDCSPDQKVSEYLNSLEQPGIVVLHNEENLGFSGTINRGLQYSQRDVLLLNADTIVTAGWIDKMLRCAYSDPAIATVTPFSNNATLCSIPNFCQDNIVPYGMSIEEYARIIERRSMRKYPRITVAVGFCMFIKREVIEKIGLFDEETFKRGYGEENDFCWRAEQMGYYHVLCDDTYIFHSGSASFLGEEKKKLMAEHEQILRGRYPRQLQENAEYVRDNPDQYLRSNVELYARLENGKKNILYVLHMDFRADASDSIGGTQFHVKDLMNQLREDHNVFVLARDGKILRLTIYQEDGQMSFHFFVEKKPQFQMFHSRELAEVIDQILGAFRIDVVHVHHVMDLSLDIFRIAKERGIPLVATLHDFFYVCPTIKLLENGSRYCGGFGEDCTQCLRSQMGYVQGQAYLSEWRENVLQALNVCEQLIAPSNAVREVYSAVYPQLKERIRVIGHGMNRFEMQPVELKKTTSQLKYQIEQSCGTDYTISGWAFREGINSSFCQILLLVEDEKGTRCQYRTRTVNRPDVAESIGTLYLHCGFTVRIPDGCFASGPLRVQLILRSGEEEFRSDWIRMKDYKYRKKKVPRIAFLGGMNETKGSALAYEMIRQSGSRYDWYIIGGNGDPNLITLEKSNVIKTGWYCREDVMQILNQNQIDLVCILPICPETFCYTASEAHVAGIPILATDIGALGERLRQDQIGWLVSHSASAREILGRIDEIFEDREQLAQMRKCVLETPHKTIAQMAEEYRQLYCTLPPAREQDGDYDVQAMYNAYVIGQADQGGYTGGSAAELIQRIGQLEATLQSINQSLEYKMVRFFNRENMPFKRQIKWLIGVAYRVYTKLFKR